ncbi:hypothetical protein [Thalassolituus sp.]|jgi:hypothetical protein|uniref:hypothetical protein n=1 Tax=Thalassolituus sp. TaxID=2030822 RepID=UPI0035111A67|nr:MAG: hypothetical protein CSH36_12050 [Thalassolituus sp.]
MKYLSLTFILSLVSVHVLAAPRLMEMLDDTQLKQTRVDYFTEVNLEDNQENSRNKELERDTLPSDSRSSENAPRILNTAPVLPATGVTVDVRRR